MQKKLDEILIFKENRSTFKETSLDDGGKENQYMVDSEIEVINFDRVKSAYIKGMRLQDTPLSSDALYERQPGEYFLVEFKNGRLNKTDIYSVQKKIYDSLLIFNDIMDTNISFCREHVDFILVYNESKNPKSTDEAGNSLDAPTPSRVAIGQHLSKKANSHFIRFGLKQFKTIYFHDIFTYSVQEFEEEFLKAQ